jgi:hypothetical protein
MHREQSNEALSSWPQHKTMTIGANSEAAK